MGALFAAVVIIFLMDARLPACLLPADYVQVSISLLSGVCRLGLQAESGSSSHTLVGRVKRN